MIIGLMGDPRSGKTLTAVRECERLYNQGYNIYSNIKLNFPSKTITLKQLENIVEHGKGFGDDNAVVFIDEIHTWIDSRASQTVRNRIISYFLLQTGKIGKSKDFGMIFLYTTQYPDLIDKRLRKPTVISGFCEKIDVSGEKIIQVEWHWIRNGEEIMRTERFFAHHYYNLYDTREIVSLEKDKYEEET